MCFPLVHDFILEAAMANNDDVLSELRIDRCADSCPYDLNHMPSKASVFIGFPTLRQHVFHYFVVKFTYLQSNLVWWMYVANRDEHITPMENALKRKFGNGHPTCSFAICPSSRVNTAITNL